MAKHNPKEDARKRAAEKKRRAVANKRKKR